MKRVCLNRVLEILNNNIADANVSNDMLEESLPALGMDSVSFIRIIVELHEVFVRFRMRNSLLLKWILCKRF